MLFFIQGAVLRGTVSELAEMIMLFSYNSFVLIHPNQQ